MLGLYEKWMTAVVWASSTPPLNASELCVLMHLLQRQNPDTGQCNPSLARLGKDAGYSRRTIKSAIDSLREKGAIDWWRPPDRKSNCYFFPDAQLRIDQYLQRAVVKQTPEGVDGDFPTVVKPASTEKRKEKKKQEKASDSKNWRWLKPYRNGRGTKKVAGLQAAFASLFSDAEAGWQQLLEIDPDHVERVERAYLRDAVTLDEALRLLLTGKG